MGRRSTRTLMIPIRMTSLLLLLAAPPLAAQSQRAILVRSDRALADSSWNHGLRQAIGAGAVEGVVLLWPDAPVVQGKKSVGLVRALDSVRVTWQPIGAELASDSTLGVSWGVSIAEARSAAAPVVGRYIATWRREAAGDSWAWRLAALMITDAPPTPSFAFDASLPLELPPLAATGAAAPFVTADLDFARLAGDSGAAVAFERWAAPDAHMFAGGGMLVEGPKAIARVMSAPATWKWHPVAAGGASDGSMGWTVGEAVITAADGHSGPSKYLTVWKRQADGLVRYFTDGGNGRPVAR